MGNPGRVYHAVAVAAFLLLSNPASAADRLITAEEKAAIQAQIELRLLDPSSAQYRWTPTIGKDGAYCAFVNAKNRFGGYVGFSPFLAWVRSPNPDGSPRVVLNALAIKPSNFTDSGIREVCRNQGIDLD